jgi:hypothetical protein
MKDQYFGDINDYRKYGLLRSIIEATELRVLVAWMLTPDDGSTDGKFTSYLDQPNKWSKYDPLLFQKIRDIVPNGQQRRVNLIESTGILPKVQYFSGYVTDSAPDRNTWFASLTAQAQMCDFVFLDPDNGLEVKSKPYGRKNSSKFVYWREIEELWSSRKSLLIYQHFIRENRAKFTQRMLEELKNATPCSLVESFSTSNVVFLMALQPNHQNFHSKIVSLVQQNWEGQIQHWEQREAT